MAMATKVKNVIRAEQKEPLVIEKLKIEEKPFGTAKPKVEVKAVEEIPQNKGLCATCNEASSCVYAKNAQRPVLYCEMFDDSSRSQETVIVDKAVKSPSEPAVQSGEHTTFKGLCINCDNRKTCTFPQPEGGVWHCEEYR